MTEPKRLHWTEAFAAYEQDYDLIESVRADYRTYVEQVLRGAGEILNAERGDDFAVVEEEEDVGPYLEIDHLSTTSGLLLQAWPTRGRGGEAGKIRVLLFLRHDRGVAAEVGEGMDAWLEETALDALKAAEGKRYVLGDCPELATMALLRGKTLWTWLLPLDAPDVSTTLARCLVEADKAAERAAAALLRGQTGNAALWARLRLLELRERYQPPKHCAWYPEKEGLSENWENKSVEGRYLALGTKDSHHPNWVYLTVTHEGDIRVAHEGSFERVRLARVQNVLGVSDKEPLGGLLAKTLLTRPQVADMMEKSQGGRLLDALTEQLDAFLTIYPG